MAPTPSPSVSPRPRSETTGRTPHGQPQRGRHCDRPAARPPGPRRAPFPGRDIIVCLPSPPFGRPSLFFYIYNPDVSSAWPAHLSRNSDVLSRLQRGARPGALPLTGRPPFDDPGGLRGQARPQPGSRAPPTPARRVRLSRLWLSARPDRVLRFRLPRPRAGLRRDVTRSPGPSPGAVGRPASPGRAAGEASGSACALREGRRGPIHPASVAPREAAHDPRESPLL